MINKTYTCDCIIAGRLERESIINEDGSISIDQPGGNLLYTAYGFTLWGKTAGLVARIGCDFPDEWIEEIGNNSINTSGLTKNPDFHDSRSYVYVDKNQNLVHENPGNYFSKNNLPLPKTLLGYKQLIPHIDNRLQRAGYSILPEHFPQEFFDCHQLALCPVDFITHNILPAYFRAQQSGGNVFIHVGRSYCHSSFFSDFAALVCGAVVLLISEENARKLFLGRSDNTLLIAEAMVGFGIENVIISIPGNGFLLLNMHNKTKILVPNYPVKCVDPSGNDDAFFGGFLAGFFNHHNLTQAAITGSVTASVMNEGSTPNFLLGALKDLLDARVEYLEEKVRIIA